MYECRCNERLQTKKFMRLEHTGLVVELEHLKIKTRLTNEKFGDLDTIGDPSRLRLMRKAAALARVRLTLHALMEGSVIRRPLPAEAATPSGKEVPVKKQLCLEKPHSYYLEKPDSCSKREVILGIGFSLNLNLYNQYTQELSCIYICIYSF